jgi:iron-sulfur cluster assembly accessory protein
MQRLMTLLWIHRRSFTTINNIRTFTTELSPNDIRRRPPPTTEPPPPPSSDIHITSRCVSRLRTIATDGECLRVTVDGGGCSGFEYKLALDRNITNDDECFERDGVRVIVDRMSLDYMRGATIDYVDELMRSTFRVVNNPVAEKGCSCGSSFALKMD